jgi:hypothetical protein
MEDEIGEACVTQKWEENFIQSSLGAIEVTRQLGRLVRR